MKSARVVAVLVLLVLVTACSGGSGADSEAPDDATGATAVEEGDFEALSGAGGGAEREEAAAEQEITADEEAAAGQEGEDAAQEPDVQELPDPPAVRTGDRIIKEGTISVEVEEGRFDHAFRAVVAEARSLGGDAVASSTRTADNGDTFGSVTVRVPVESFEDLVVGVGDIGEVRTRDVDSQDVSAEFTDLESRLRHLQAQERFYLGLFDEAESVQDAISVQQQLDGIQSQIEKVQGRLNLLDDRTSFSTLTVELFEPGVGGSLVEDDPGDRPSLAGYWDIARDAFVNVVGAMLVVGFFVLPLLVPAAVVGALWLGRRRSRPGRAGPVEDVEEREPVGAGR